MIFKETPLRIGIPGNQIFDTASTHKVT